MHLDGRVPDLGHACTRDDHEGAEEQSSVAEEMNRNVVSISNVANETASGAEQTAEEGEVLAEQAVELQSLVRQFRL